MVASAEGQSRELCPPPGVQLCPAVLLLRLTESLCGLQISEEHRLQIARVGQALVGPGRKSSEFPS